MHCDEGRSAVVHFPIEMLLDSIGERIRVVIVSIVATEHRKRAVGATALIDKPVRREDIEEVLRQYTAHPVPDVGEQLGGLIKQTLAAAV